jgi:spermidine synthase
MTLSLRKLFFITVFLTGAAVLIFEVTAVRALSPHFGTSIYVVSSVLTTILAALSLGYYFGGRLADKFPDIRLLYLIIGFSGLLMNLLYLLSLYFFPYANQLFPITYGPLVLSIFFYFTPAFLLGIDSPFVIKLLTKTGDDSHNGAVVGSVFFWSTVGSITGSLASGFLLIPFIGVKLTFVITATALSLFACIAYLYAYQETKDFTPRLTLLWIFSITIVSVTLATIIIRSLPVSAKISTLLHQSDGYYSQIEIREYRPSSSEVFRILHRDINNSSAIQLGTTTFAFVYPEYARAYRYLQEDTEDLLMIGGGAYTIPRTLLLEDPNLHIDVVEIEPSLYELAQQYFELPDSPRLQNFATDARTFIQTVDKEYDFIFVDAFQSGHFIPTHLSTTEFFGDIRDILSPDGVLVINLIGIPDQNDTTLIGSLIKTIRTSFPNFRLYAASEHTTRIRNITLVAKCDDQPFSLPDTFLIDLKNGSTTPATELAITTERFFLDKQLVFTDDKAPVEMLVAKQILDSE